MQYTRQDNHRYSNEYRHTINLDGGVQLNAWDVQRILAQNSLTAEKLKNRIDECPGDSDEADFFNTLRILRSEFHAVYQRCEYSPQLHEDVKTHDAAQFRNQRKYVERCRAGCVDTQRRLSGDDGVPYTDRCCNVSRDFADIDGEARIYVDIDSSELHSGSRTS